MLAFAATALQSPVPDRLKPGPKLCYKEVSALLGIHEKTVARWRQEKPTPAPFTRHPIFIHRWEVDPIELKEWLLERVARQCLLLSSPDLTSPLVSRDGMPPAVVG